MRYLNDSFRCSHAPSDLRHALRNEDFWKFKIDETELEDTVSGFSEQFYSSKGCIERLKQKVLSGRTVFCADTLYDTLCLRRTDQILRRALNHFAINRDEEIRQLIEVFREEENCWVFRTDVLRFFENLTLSSVVSTLASQGFRNNYVLDHLSSLSTYLWTNFSYAGLPAGIGLSSTLSDYSMRSFDHAVITNDSVIHYSRYVDDICIVHFCEPSEIREAVEKAIPNGLSLNNSKTEFYELRSSKTLSFLGYCFGLDGQAHVSVDTKKIGRIKTRIVLSIRAFLKDADFGLLYDRLRFLSSSVKMTKIGRDRPVYAGVTRVYRRCTPDLLGKQLCDLDNFYHGVLCSRRFGLSGKLAKLLKPSEMKCLRRLSFAATQKKGIMHSLEKDRVAEIKRAWKYEQA